MRVAIREQLAALVLFAATASQLGTLGVNSANSIAGNLSSMGSNIGQQMNNAAAANASGIYNSAAAWGGALGGTSNSINSLLTMQNLMGGGSGGGGFLGAPGDMQTNPGLYPDQG